MTNENKNKRYYWIKLKDTFFTSDTVDFLMSQKNGANYVVLYQMLCLKSVNTQGELSRKIGEMIIPFDVDKIHRDCKYFDIDTIRVALELYIRLGLIYEQDNGILQIANFDNMVGSETQGAVEKRQQRYQKKLEESRGIDNGIDRVYQDNRDKILDIRDKRIDNRDKIEEDDVSDDTTKLQSNSVDYKYIVDSFNSICKSYSKVTKLSESRKKAIRCRVKTYGVDTIIQCFNKAEDSDFLKGKNDKNWSANFDWIMEDRNMAKILDGNYDNKRFADTHSKKPTASPDSDEAQREFHEDLKRYGLI